MMENIDNVFFKSVTVLVGQLCGLADDVLPIYKGFAEDVLCNRITNIDMIEHRLDSMVAYCFDDRILSLYKKVLQKLYSNHPDTVETYVELYYSMFEEEAGEIE